MCNEIEVDVFEEEERKCSKYGERGVCGQQAEWCDNSAAHDA